MGKNIMDHNPECMTLLEMIPLGEDETLPDGIIMRATAKVGQADRITQTGRLYRRKVIQNQLEAIKPNLVRRAVHGLSGHPDMGTNPDPDKEFGVITKLWMDEDGSVHANWDVLDTPSGRIVATKAKAKVHIGFSSRGRGSAEIVKYSESLPEYHEGDKQWLGKEVQIINDDYQLQTYDTVVMGSVTDTRVTSFREDTEENNMDITKFTDEDWKAILEHDKVKTLVQESVDSVDVTKLVQEYLESEKGIETVREKLNLNESEDKEEEVVEMAKCKSCETDMLAESKFCPECGTKVELVEASPEEKDEVIAALTKKLDEQSKTMSDLSESVEKMAADKKAAEDAAKVSEILNTVCESADNTAAEIVRSRFTNGKIEVTPEDAETVFNEAIEHYKNILEQGKATKVPTGEGKVIPLDEAAEKKEKEAGKGLVEDVASIAKNL